MTEDILSAAALRAPDGTTWYPYTTGPTAVLRAVVQDPDTGEWDEPRTVRERTVPEEELADYEVIPREPLRDPRITRLAGLVGRLLADYEEATGRPAAAADEVREALAAVAAIPDEAVRRRVGAARQAAHTAYSRRRRR
ncbi:hypothetical protein [Streptomyces sp. URMC 129]|uniref:hypothetical protein n=1 Tax=Streptomyces sp. URMC 129 TaxID=3423407 RepID=UPI003F1CC709